MEQLVLHGRANYGQREWVWGSTVEFSFLLVRYVEVSGRVAEV